MHRKRMGIRTTVLAPCRRRLTLAPALPDHLMYRNTTILLLFTGTLLASGCSQGGGEQSKIASHAIAPDEQLSGEPADPEAEGPAAPKQEDAADGRKPDAVRVPVPRKIRYTADVQLVTDD